MSKRTIYANWLSAGRGLASLVCVFLVFLAGKLDAAEWRPALPGWRYEFPRDHRRHADFKTEWWYFTGRLTDEKGAVFGYQLTFFRQGLRPPANRASATSRFVVDDLKFAHFAVSDIGGQRFHFQQKIARGAFGEAGFADEQLAWIDDWSLELLSDGSFALRAKNGPAALDLKLSSAKPWVFHGENGVSQKAEGVGRASHYFSATRLAAKGTLTLDGKTRGVSGESWLDREWASNQLTAEQIGWDWFSIQFDDGTELMLYQMRTRGGGRDPNSSGTFVARDGTTQHLRRDDYQLTPLKTWTSKETGGKYPVAWQLDVPKLNLQARISTPLQKQELVLQPVVYWEGLIEIEATRAGAKTRGHGYMELTGYAGALVGLSE
jgi:predicted secreted hydrolase